MHRIYHKIAGDEYVAVGRHLCQATDILHRTKVEQPRGRIGYADLLKPDAVYHKVPHHDEKHGEHSQDFETRISFFCHFR